MKIKSIALCLLAAGILSTACISEDHTDCFNKYYLALSYTGDDAMEIFPSKITKVEMYVFDENNRCVSSGQLSDKDVQARLTELPALNPGTYKIVCLGNTFNTSVDKLSSANYDEINFADKAYRSGETVSGNDELYWASMDYVIAPYDEKKLVETRTIKFASSHYDVIVDVEGAVYLESHNGDQATLELQGVLPVTDFKNTAEGAATTYYLDTVSSNSNAISSQTSIMRHKDHASVNLVLKDGYGNIVKTVNFAEHIAKYNINTELHECVIPIKITIDGFSGEIKVTVPSWFLVEVKPEF